VIVQAPSVVAEPWGISVPTQRELQVAVATGLSVAVTLAWRLGEKGRQSLSSAELLILALLLAISGTRIAVVVR
jgi:hypothetical protein